MTTASETSGWLSWLQSALPNVFGNPAIAPLASFMLIVMIGIAAAALLRSLRSLGSSGQVSPQTSVFGPLSHLLAWLPPCTGASAEGLRRELRQAGHYRRHAFVDFLAIRNSLVLGTLLLTLAISHGAGLNADRDPRLLVYFLGTMCSMVLFSTPRLCLQAKARGRVKRIQQSVPDALDMVTMCMSGGLSLLQALERVRVELQFSHPDLAVELAIVQGHAETYTLEHAMSQFAERMETPEVSSLANVVAQTERLGANVGAALLEFSDDIRRAFRQRAEERGNRVSVKMLLPVALCLAPPVYILLLAPALLELRSFVTEENRPGGVLAPADASVLESARNAPLPPLASNRSTGP